MRRIAALAVASLVALVAPAAGQAHVILERTSPATQSSVARAPTEVRLEFNQPVSIAGNAVQVLAADGTVVSGAPSTTDRGRVVRAPVSGLGRGTAYTVRWRVIGGDGHAPAGVYTFGVGVPAPPPTEAVGAGGSTWKDDVARWALFIALALLIGPLAVRLFVLRGDVPAALEQRFHLVGVIAAFLVIDAGIAAFVLRASNALQLPVAELLYGDLQPFAEKTRFGVAFLVMTVGFGAVGTLLLAAWVFDRLELRLPALSLSIALASGISLSGHQATEPNSSLLSQLADWLHLVAASVWVGGLVALAFCVWPAAPGLRRTAFLGFARLAVLLVGVLVLAGGYLAIVRLPQLSDLWETEYGRFLLLKLVVVSIALGWGAVHHFFVRPRLESGAEPAIRPSLVGEVAVAFAVLLAAAMLTNVAPPPVEDEPVVTARAAR